MPVIKRSQFKAGQKKKQHKFFSAIWATHHPPLECILHIYMQGLRGTLPQSPGGRAGGPGMGAVGGLRVERGERWRVLEAETLATDWGVGCLRGLRGPGKTVVPCAQAGEAGRLAPAPGASALWTPYTQRWVPCCSLAGRQSGLACLMARLGLLLSVIKLSDLPHLLRLDKLDLQTAQRTATTIPVFILILHILFPQLFKSGNFQTTEELKKY